MSRPITDAAEAAALLARLFAEASSAVVLTGAGLSTESGIPDYRSPGGLWSRMRPIEFGAFVASEAARLEDWRRRVIFEAEFAAARPNAGHLALARLAAAGRIDLLVTQNIDGLHTRAGTPPERLIEIHGNGTYATCLACGRRMEIAEAEATIAATGASPRCPACGGLVKAAVVSFGQAMPEAEMRRATRAARGCDLFVAVGSSLQVHPAAGLPIEAERAGARLVIVNGEATPLDPIAEIVVHARLGEVLGRLGETPG